MVAHAEAAAEIDQEVAQTIADGEKLSTGGLEIEAIYTPGHAAGHVAFLVNGSDVFTADVLFKGTVGGTMAPGASGFADLKASVMRLTRAAAGDHASTPATASRPRSATSGRPTLLCGSGAARRRPARRR